MKSKEEFIKLVDARFFKHLNTKSLILFGEKRKRTEYLSFVYDNLLSNIINYKPNPPRKYISFPKSRYVIRMVPKFELDDYCIYYFCLKVLEGGIRGTDTHFFEVKTVKKNISFGENEFQRRCTKSIIR